MVVPEPDATWGLDFAHDDGTAGFLRLLRFADRCWCWAYLVGPGVGLVVVRDHEVAPPRRDEILVVHADGLWMELVCETPGEHWTYGLEAFAVRLDDPRDAWRELGARLPLGFDLEWETDGSTSGSTGTAYGELLVADTRVELDAAGVLCNAVGADAAWPTEWTGACRLSDGRWVRPSVAGAERADLGLSVPASTVASDGRSQPVETLVALPIPLARDASGTGAVLVRALARVQDARGVTGVGWLEVLQSGVRTSNQGYEDQGVTDG